MNKSSFILTIQGSTSGFCRWKDFPGEIDHLFVCHSLGIFNHPSLLSPRAHCFINTMAASQILFLLGFRKIPLRSGAPVFPSENKMGWNEVTWTRKNTFPPKANQNLNRGEKKNRRAEKIKRKSSSMNCVYYCLPRWANKFQCLHKFFLSSMKARESPRDRYYYYVGYRPHTARTEKHTLDY